jgi:hypothetical protein
MANRIVAVAPSGGAVASPIVPVPRLDRRSAGTVGLAVLPVVVAVVRLLVAHRAPLGDNGLIALRAHDVLSADHPWFGTWTSASLSAGVDVNNPSPLHFDALALFVKPFGVSAGAVLGAGFLNAAAIAVAVRQGYHFAARRGEVMMALAAVALSFTLGSEMLADPWQPHNLVLPFFAFLASCVALASGRWASAPWAVVIGSLVMGAHLSFTYVVLLVLLASLVAAWRRSPEGLRRGVLAVVVSGLVAWSQPIIEQLFGAGRGNLGRMLQATGGNQDSLGLPLGVRLVGQVLVSPPWWLRPSFTSAIPETGYSTDGVLRPHGLLNAAWAALGVVVVLAVLLGLVVTAWRAGRHVESAPLLVATVGLLAALGTATVMPAGVLGLAPHQVRWMWPIAALVWVAVANSLDLRVVRARVPAAARAQVVLGAVVVLVVANLPAHSSDLGPYDSRAANGAIRSLMAQVEAVGLPGPTYFDGSNLVFAEPYSGPVLAALAEAGEPIRAGDASFARQLGEHRRRQGDERYALQVRSGDGAHDVVEGETVLASATGPAGTPVEVVLIDLSVSGG